ncbi:hypothetical protein Smp_124190 [Schistosoma mansoni]|uniref:hypothetical protein n=1 Tax=Schistosoma mansoni TaxID=6183 RepID=UPI0001A6410A|nr:hypothetical protein Smp_124190 [Schistosoma mansoni]|eukprot:XP_018647645.1 hypothetical protein Smp_124190 [Schistosoma mansoni]
MNPLKVEEVLNGRIESDLFVPSRLKPYKIMSDITVMPGVELQIEAGVKFEFAPHIGLLVLGRIEARGTHDNPIIFTSINNSQLENNQFSSMIKSNLMFTKLRKPNIVNTNNNHRPTTETYSSIGRITLSTENVRLIGGEQSNEGFVQFFNYSTRNWYIACDKQFSTRVAQVVCSEFNVSTLTAIVRFSNLYDHYVYGFQNLLNIKHIWMESYTCNGFESKLAYCRRRLNYDAVQCLKRKDFAFLRCVPQTNKALSMDKKTIDLSTSTWGNIRIVQPNSEHYPTMLPNNHMTYTKKQSVLEYINIENAGLLHGERVPALTIVYAYPKLSFIKINNCFDSGLELITPNGPVKLTNCTISKCLGRGLGLTIFNSDSTDPVTIGTENSKSFYNNPSTFPPEQHSLFPLPQPLSGHILFNGKLSNEFARSPLNEYPFKNEEILFGFIPMCSSEKVISVLDRVLVQFKYSSWLNGIHSCTKVFRSTIPGRRLAWRFLAVNLYYDPLIENFIQLYNGVNQTANQVITVITQGTLSMNGNDLTYKHYTFITSPIHDEFSVYVHTSSVSDDKYGFIAEIISLPLSAGRKQQEMRNHFNAIQVLRNYIAHNDCGYRTMIHINGLLSQPFANNFIYDNRADILLKCEGDENLNQYSIYQKNGFYNNQALNLTKRTTIFCKNSKNIFRYNYFRNILNDYELVTGNQSIISVLPIQSGFQCPTSPYTSCPQGWKLRLEYDALNYANSYLSNSSTLGQGIYCPPNWDFYEFNCFYYFGAPMTYQEANDFCLSEVDGILATSQDRIDWLGKKLREWQHNYDWINRYTWVTRAWVDSDAQFPTHCTVIRNGWLEPYPCNKKIGFFCQKTFEPERVKMYIKSSTMKAE